MVNGVTRAQVLLPGVGPVELVLNLDVLTGRVVAPWSASYGSLLLLLLLLLLSVHKLYFKVVFLSWELVLARAGLVCVLPHRLLFVARAAAQCLDRGCRLERLLFKFCRKRLRRLSAQVAGGRAELVLRAHTAASLIQTLLHRASLLAAVLPRRFLDLGAGVPRSQTLLLLLPL